MPQLMPLMWINSVAVSLLIMLMLINMYCVSEDYSIEYLNCEDKVILVKLMW